MKKRRNKIIVSIIGITIITFALLGFTYGYYLTRIIGNINDTSVSINTAFFELKYEDDTNEILFKDFLMPGTEVGSKSFTVTNTGTEAVNNYGIYIEDVVNELKYTETMKISLTCKSIRLKTNEEYGTCNGISESRGFPTVNERIVTNSIQAGVRHEYTLTIYYENAPYNQSDDMGKTIKGKIQIYDENTVVTMYGNISGVDSNYSILVNSNPKTSEIKNGTYQITGLETGEHKIQIINPDGTILSSKKVKIKLGNKIEYSDNEIIITKDTQNIKLNLIYENSSINTEVKEVKTINNYQEGTIAYAILENSINGNNGTHYRETPLSTPAVQIPEKKKFYDEGETVIEIDMQYKDYYITYGKKYDYDDITGNYKLLEKNSCKLSDNSCRETLKGKYIQHSADDISRLLSSTEKIIDNSKVNFTHIEKIIDISDNDKIQIKVNKYSNTYTSLEKTLSKTKDNHGDSYYFRGDVEDNYVTFNNMCWRIVRIVGDGSIKLILSDPEEGCSENTLTKADSSVIGSGSYGYTTVNGVKYPDYINSTNGMRTTLLTWYNNNLKNVEDKLKFDTWCLGNLKEAYSINGVKLTNDTTTIDTLVTAKTQFYYEDTVNVYGLGETKNASLVCSSDATTDTSYIGTLDINEAAFAGNVRSMANKSNYLYANTTKKDGTNIRFWLLNPASHRNSSGKLFQSFALQMGAAFETRTVETTTYYRPAITLKVGTLLKSGNGTITNPYIVQ